MSEIPKRPKMPDDGSYSPGWPVYLKLEAQYYEAVAKRAVEALREIEVKCRGVPFKTVTELAICKALRDIEARGWRD